VEKRKFNQAAYDAFDMQNKLRLIEIIESNSDYKLFGNINVERYKMGDVLFKNKKKTVLFENETRADFEKIVLNYNSIHIPLRKQNTPANFYIVWKIDLCQFILINKKTLNKYKNNIVNVKCNYNQNQEYAHDEDFIDIPKEETQWYVIGENLKLIKLSYE